MRLTVQLNVTDKDKLDYLWDAAKNPQEAAATKGFKINRLSWGWDAAQAEYVLERVREWVFEIHMRNEIMEREGMEAGRSYFADETLQDLMEKWEKEAQEKYGSE